MRPNTLHAVFTPEHVICHGGHFYATTTMQDTMFGIVNTFIFPDVLTNADKQSHSQVLRRIAAFYYDVLVLQRLDESGTPLTSSSIPAPDITNPSYFFHQSTILVMPRRSQTSSLCLTSSHSAT